MEGSQQQVPQGPPTTAPSSDPTAATGTSDAEAKQDEELKEGATPSAPDHDEANPAEDQAPVATAAQEAIIGDQGARREQQPLGVEGTPTSVDQPVRTSAPPAELQSGVPLAEDRAAGVEPGPAGPLGPGGVPAAVQGGPVPPQTEAPEKE